MAVMEKSRQQAAGQEEEEDELDLGDVFPEEARSPSPEPSVVEYVRPHNGQTLHIQLVNKHPLWGHVLYPTAKVLAGFLTEQAESYVRGKRVLELGAGGGLPSLVSALEGAQKTVVTDFPDVALIANLQKNIDMNIPPELRASILAEGYTWGSRTARLRALIAEAEDGEGIDLAYDTILAADLVFNHSQHLALLKTCEDLLDGSPTPVLLCFYAHHRTTPELIKKDRGFVELALERGWAAEKVVEDTEAGPAFPDDHHYDLSLRSTVHGYRLVPPSASSSPRIGSSSESASASGSASASASA